MVRPDPEFFDVIRFKDMARRLAEPARRPDGRPYESLGEAACVTLANEFALPLAEAQACALDAGILPERYVRNLDALSPREQARLLRGRVVLVGLGGLGGNVLETLVRLGVGRIEAADGDRFEESNLNRQVLAEGATLGRTKAKAALARVRGINLAVELTAHDEFWTQGDMDRALDGAHVCVDALGGLDSRPALAEAASRAGVPLVTAAAAGMSGYVATVLPGQPGPDALMGTGEAAEDSLGCPAPGVAVAANMQCAEVVSILAGNSPSLAGSMLLFDLKDMTFEKVTISN